jgi:hypothetical protein
MSLDETQGAAPAPVDNTPAPIADAPAPAATESASPEVGLEDSLAKVWAKNNPARGDDGKFASRETPVKQDEAAAVEGEPKPDAPKVEAQPAPAPVVDAPRAWTAEQKALWAKIPPEAQPIIAQRETELHEIKTAAGRMAAEVKPIRDAFNQHADYLNHIQQRPEQWLNNALSISRQLDSGQAPQVIKALADQYGVDLGQIYDPLAPPPDQRVLELERKIASLEYQRQSEQQSRAASTEAAQLSEFDRIATEFKTANPDATEIEDDIVAEINAIRQQQPNLDPAALLKQAYERAAWANEKTRTKRLEAQVAERVKAQEEARVSAAKEAAAKARSAASVNVAGSAASSDDGGDLDSMLRSVYRKTRSR